MQQLRDIKKRHTRLLRTKIKALRDRKQAKREEALETTETTAEVENVLSPSEEDLIITGLGEEIKKFEDEVAKLNESAQSYQDLIDGKYGEGQDVAAAAVSLKEVKKKIAVVKAKITKRRNKINSINEERELEKLRQDRDAAERAGLAPEGQEPEGKDITPGEGTPAEGLDGILSEEQVKALRQQREEAERLRKLEEQKKKAQEVTPQPINLTPAPITVTTAGTMDVRLAKGEKTIMDGKVLVSETGESIPNAIVPEIQRVPMKLNLALISNPFIAAEGTEVRFEVREDFDFWLSQTPAPGEEWKNVPILMYVKDQAGEEQAVGLLQKYTPNNNPGQQGAMRKDIYDLYKKGLTPVATSAGKIYDSTNYSNAIVFAEDKQTGLQKRFSFFYPASTLVNTGETPAVVFVGIQDFQKSWKLATAGDTNFPNLADTILSFKVSPALETGGNQAESVLGQVGIIVMDPNGAPRVVMASTRNMTEAGRTAALAKIEAEEPSLNQFAQIVGTNLLLNDSVDPAAGDQVYTEINGEMEREYSEAAETFMAVETLANGTELVTFYSPSAKSLVRMNAANMKVALAGGTPMFSFVEVGQNDKGHTALVTVKKDGSVRKGIESNLANEFKAAIMKKKFQVDKNMLNSKEAYTSPISGQVYDSYFQYLTSENEVPEERTEGKGTKAILGVDTEVNSQKSPFFDVGIKTTNLGTREQDVTTERELAARQVVMPTDNSPTSYPITETPSAPTTDVKTNVKGSLAAQGTSIELEVVGDTGKEFLLTVDRKGNISLFSEKQPDGSYKSGDLASKEAVINLYKKYIPSNTILKIQKWVASFNGSWAAPETEDGKKYDKAEKELIAELAALGQPVVKSTADEFGFSNLGNIGNQGLAIIEADLNKNGIHTIYTKGATEAQLAKIENDIKLLESKYNIRVVKGTSGRGPRIDIKLGLQIGVTHTLKNQQVYIDHPEGETSVPIIDYQNAPAESYEGTKIKVTAATTNTVTAEITYPDGESFTDTFDKKDFQVKVIVLPSSPQVPAITQPAPTVSDEEKVVEITGAEDTSGTFGRLGIPTETPKAPESVNSTTGLPSFFDRFKVDETFVPPSDVEDFAAMAARNQAQAEYTKKQCKGE